jgi:starch phosphorylase
MPSEAKAAIDEWTSAAEIRTGRVFRPINKGGRLTHIQLVFAGTAHPQDEGGKFLIGRVVSRWQRDTTPIYSGSHIFPNYDMEWGRLITSSVDFWLNTGSVATVAGGFGRLNRWCVLKDALV